MRKFLTAIMLVAITMVAPAQAEAKSKRVPTICEKAYNVRTVVIKKHGKRAPGRNICRFGLKSGKKASTKQKAAYLRQLRSLIRPPFYQPILVRVAVPPKQSPAGTLSTESRAPAGGRLASIRQCESGSNYSINTGNGFFGAYQFTPSTWRSVGGTGMPHQASPAEQDKRAAILLARNGGADWPNC